MPAIRFVVQHLNYNYGNSKFLRVAFLIQNKKYGENKFEISLSTYLIPLQILLFTKYIHRGLTFAFATV